MKKSMSTLKRLLAVLMVFALVIGYVPMGVAAEEATTPVASTLTTSITEGQVFAINETVAFTYTSTANSDAGKMVRSYFTIYDEAGAKVNDQVAKIEYWGVTEQQWLPCVDSFGPTTGYPMMDATSNFRITFTNAGNYRVHVQVLTMDTNVLLCENTVNVVAQEVSSTVSSTLPEKAYLNIPVEFGVTTDANSNSGKMVLGAFKVMNGETEIADISTIGTLEYLESKDGKWYPLSGDFGPAGGFPMSDATSKFRVTFTQAGNYTVTTSMKLADASQILCSEEKTIAVERMASTLTTDMAGKTYEAGRVTNFTFTTVPNSDVNTMVKGSFSVLKNGNPVYIADVAKLEYLDVTSGNWFEFYGDFGPSTGFTLTNATSNFRVTFKQAGTYTVTASMKSVADGTHLCIASTAVTVTYPAADITLKGGAAIEDKWYSAAQTVTVSVPNVASEDCLTTVKVNGIDNSTAWTNDGSNNWSKDIPMPASGSVSYGDQVKNIKIDTVVPTVKIEKSYSRGRRNPQTVVKYTVTVGESKAASIVVNGTKVDLSNVEWTNNGNGTYSHTFTTWVPGEVDPEVVVTSGAGLTGSNTEFHHQGAMVVTFQDPAENTVIGTVGSTVYAPSGVVTVYVSNATAEGTDYALDTVNTIVTAKDQDGAAITPSAWTFNGSQWTCTVSLANGLSALSVKPVSAEPVEGGTREGDTEEYTTVYAVDKEDPKVTVSRNASPVRTLDSIEYFDKEVSYTVTIKDELMVGKNNEHNYYLEINGIKQPDTIWNGYEASFTLKNGETLENVTIYAKDASGNVAKVVGGGLFNWTVNENGTVTGTGTDIVDRTNPDVTVTVSENVKYFYIKDGNVYAVLDPVRHEDMITTLDTETVTLTIKVTDQNLRADDFEAVGSTWSVDEEKGEATITFTTTVERHQTNQMVYEFSFRDAVYHTSNSIKVSSYGTEQNEFTTGFEMKAEGGVFKGAFDFDRRSPSSNNDLTSAPKIVLTTEAKNTVAANGKDLYAGSFTFDMFVSDESGKKFDSGVESVTWEIDDNLGGVDFITTNNNDKVSDDGNYVIEINAGDPNESNEVKLTVTVADMLGNSYVYYKTFAVDTLAPRVAVKYDNNDVQTKEYFQSARTATVTVEDINYNGITINGEAYEGNSLDIPYTKEGEHTLTIEAADKADNAMVDWTNAEGTAAPKHFYIDLNNPEIKVEVTGAAVTNSDDQANYHNGEVTYKFTVTDIFMVENGVTAVVTYEDGTTFNVPMVLKSTENTLETDEDKYEGEITLTDGQVITEITVNALDRSGRTSSWSHTANETEKAIVVDTTAPFINVTKSVEDGKSYIQTYEGVDYYNGEVIYTVQVEDKFLTSVGTAQLIAHFSDGMDSVIDIINGTMLLTETEASAKLGDMDTYTIPVPVADGVTLTGITLQVIDNAGNVVEYIDNVAANLTVEDKDNTAEKALTAFAYNADEKTWTYTGHPVVVDTVNPTATLEFSENVKSVYTHTDSETNKTTVYVVLTNPVVGESGVNPAQAPENVTVTIDVNDKNLAIDAENTYGVKADTFAWAGETPVNTDSTITYTASSVSVNPDGTATFVIDVKVSDLAGNVLTAVTQETPAVDGTVWPVVVDAEGGINYTVSLDRMRPTSSTEDTTVPTITIKPVDITPSKTADGLDLFNGSFVFDMSVTDGTAGNNNSGLKYVHWTIKDPNGVVVDVNDGGEDYDTQTMSDTYEINVNLTGKEISESNAVLLEITAEDNVGNQITYHKTFGVDTEAPRVTIIEGNDDYLLQENGKYYFKADQTITVQIEDLNFESSLSTVDTEVAFGGWEKIGENLYSTTLVYNTDGHYTFAMASADLAGNKAVIDYTNHPSVPSFTVDKTLPVIHVTFNPFNPVDTDNNLVQYFDDVRTVTVTIEEHNFEASDVVANLGPANALGIWSTSGDSHTASEMFTEGNGYSVSINYTDLAGNPAVAYVSPTFSIDLEAPVIELTKGDMSTGTLNIVPDDLLLGFTITDHQENLKDFSIEVIFLNNNYEQTKVEGVEYYTVTDGDRTTGYIDFTNIKAVKENDGIYTVRVTAQDYAGHVVNFPDVVFSLNRFGSTFTVSDSYTSSFLTADGTGVIYQNEVTGALVITEINPNRVWQDAEQTVEGSTITVAANGNSVTLVPGEDYEVSVTEKGTGSNKWFEYTYTINPDVFNRDSELVDGEYTIFFYSEDEAGNKNTNESNEGSALLLGSDGNYSGKVTFTLDHKAPVVTVLNIEEGGQYVEANKNVEINVSDNTPVSIAVYINDVLVEYVESAEGQPLTSDWLTYDPESGNYVLNMSEKDEVQNVRVVVTDAAGNVFEQTIGDITLTENLWVQFINNEILVIGSIVGLIGLIILIILLLKKRKKKEEETAAV